MKYKDIVDKIQEALNGGAPASSPNRSYATVLAIKMPLPARQQETKKERKTDVVSKEWNKEVKNTSDCSSYLDALPHPAADLIPARVHRWNIKNYSAIAQKMQKLSKSKAEMPDKISVITSSEKEQHEREDKKQDELWRDMMKTHEERHFRIGRITNFFS